MPFSQTTGSMEMAPEQFSPVAGPSLGERDLITAGERSIKLGTLNDQVDEAELI